MWFQVFKYQLQCDPVWIQRKRCTAWDGKLVQSNFLFPSQGNTKGRRNTREIHEIPPLQHSHSLQLLLALGISWAWGGCWLPNSQHSPLPNTWPISPAPQRNTLYPACHLERHRSHPLPCDCSKNHHLLFSHYHKSDGLYSKKPVAAHPLQVT